MKEQTCEPKPFDKKNMVDNIEMKNLNTSDKSTKTNKPYCYFCNKFEQLKDTKIDYDFFSILFEYVM